MLAAWLVARGHQQEGRVISIGGDDACRLVFEPGVDRLAVAQSRGSVGPGGGFDLVVEAHLVGGDECGLGRAVGVEAEVVQAVRAGDGQQALPEVDIGGRVAGLREDAAFERSPQRDGVAVKQQAVSASGDRTQAEAGFCAGPSLIWAETR